MISRSAAATGCLVAALGFGVAACGDDSGGESKTAAGSPAKSLTIYSSHAAAGRGARAVRGGRQRRQAGARAGRRQGRATSRSSTSRSTTRPRRRPAGRRTRRPPTRARPRRTTRRPATSASSTPARARCSIPILNEAGIAQISPANTAVGMTSDDPGATPGEPDKYYPTGMRTYARVVPKDTIQGAALVDAGEGGRAAPRCNRSTTRRSTARAWPRTSSSSAKKHRA